ncbi:hypothetical protein Pyn_09306 [Prunus yedoensis var. nudiflora]|uniref:Uncharacterized protein n=1 Tax=Prunus yedoensis var. nudiflora TaxID=2094558 RepID=A0A314Y6Q6_PRUYE|nr:hypothetical protein Pyn_09306 [Prunus yedoensis var. nudiflora]
MFVTRQRWSCGQRCQRDAAEFTKLGSDTAGLFKMKLEISAGWSIVAGLSWKVRPGFVRMGHDRLFWFGAVGWSE